MPTCNNCEGEYTAEELERHEHGRNLKVKCPDCGKILGTYYVR